MKISFFFWGRMPPEIPSDSHLWNKNDFEAIQKHPEFTSSKGWTVLVEQFIPHMLPTSCHYPVEF